MRTNIFAAIIFALFIGCKEHSFGQKDVKREPVSKNDMIVTKNKVDTVNTEFVFVDNSFVSNFVFNLRSITKNKLVDSVIIIDSTVTNCDFKFKLNNEYKVTGKISNDEDLHTALFKCYFLKKAAFKLDTLFYKEEMMKLSKAFIRDSVPVKMIKCPDEKRLVISDSLINYYIFASGGNFNEISIDVYNKKDSFYIEVLIRDVGDLRGYKIDCK